MDIYEHRRVKLLPANDLRLEGNHDGAVAAYTDAIQALADIRDAEYLLENYLSRGLAYRAKGVFGNALADYDEAVQLVSQNKMSRYACDLEAYFYRANIRAVTGDISGALADLEMALQIDPKQDYLGMQLFYVHPSDLQFALADCNQAIATNPGAYLFYYFRGITYQVLGDMRLALDDYELAVVSLPHDSRVQQLCRHHQQAIQEKMSMVNPSDSNAMLPNMDYCRVSYDSVSGEVSLDTYDMEKHERRSLGRVDIETFCETLEAQGWMLTSSQLKQDGVDYYFQRPK